MVDSKVLYARAIALSTKPIITGDDLLRFFADFDAVSSLDGDFVDNTDPLHPVINASIAPTWQKLSVTATNLATDSTTKKFDFDLLQINEIVHAVVLIPTTKFSGGVIGSYSVTVGVSGVEDKYLGASDLLQDPAGDLNYSKTPAAIVPESNNQTTTLSIFATSDVATNLATHGAFDIYWLTSILP